MFPFRRISVSAIIVTAAFIASAVDGGIAVKDGDAIAFLGDSITSQGNKPAGYVNLVMKGLEVADLNADMHRTLDEMRAKAKAKGERLPSKLLTVDGVHMAFPGNCMMAWGVLRALGVPDILKADIEVAWRKIPVAYNVQAKFTAEEYDSGSEDVLRHRHRPLRRPAGGGSEVGRGRWRPWMKG